MINNFLMTTLTSSFRSNKSYNSSKNTLADIYQNCYNQYKREYANDDDFSIKSEDITQEIQEI